MSAIKFGMQLMKLYAGANFGQIALKEEDHNKEYSGRRLPLSVSISCTYHCNLNCTHCQAENNNAKPDIPTDRFLRLIDEIADAGCTKIGFTGGEPMIRRDFGQILDRCRQRGLIISVVTNGWFVKKNIDWLKGIHLLFLSLDGDKAEHDRIRGEGNYDKFIESVEAAREAKIPVAALSTLMSNNYHCIEGMAKIVRENRMHWMVGMVQTGFTDRTDQDLTPEQLKRAVEIISREKKNLRTSSKYLSFVLGGEPLKTCWAGIGYCIIGPDGKVYPCYPAELDHEGYDGVAARAEQGGAGKGPTGPLPKDQAYQGVSILNKPFAEAFYEMKLYRRTCDSCVLACHAESNFLMEFGVDNVRQSLKLMSPIAA